MTKKYRLKDLPDRQAIIHTESGPDSDFPVVYSHNNTYWGWLSGRTAPLNHPSCCIEEAPQEPIKVGDKFGPYQVVFIDHGRLKYDHLKYDYLAVSLNGECYSASWLSEKSLRDYA